MSNLGILDILLIVFIVLKLIGVINWSWCWILAPLWIHIVLVIIIAFVAWWLK